MTPLAVPGTPRRPASTRVRSARPKPDEGVGSYDKSKLVSSEPPRKKRRYIPGGPGGGGRYVDEDGTEIPVGGTGPGGYNYVGPRGRVGRENAAMGLIPQVFPRRDRSARTRTVLPRSQQPAMRFSSAAQAAAVVQSDGYKPREERAWEEFHPDLDIDAPLRAFSAHQIEGIVDSRPVTPTMIAVSAGGSTNGTPNGIEGTYAKSEGIATPTGSLNGEISTLSIPGTPGGPKRKPGRPPKNPTEFYAAKAVKVGAILNTGTPKAPKIIIPVSNIGAKEKLTLPHPSYRKTDTLARFEDRALGLVRYVDKSMARVGYQESDNFDRPQDMLIKVSDGQMDDDLDPGPGHKSDGETIVSGSGVVGRVEYDMDEQDDKWLSNYNAERAGSNFEQVTREIFEITITKIEKEWHTLEKRIPKPNPKPPQTHRPRSSSAAAVNGEPQVGEEQDSKCAICDDGDCENTNAIVFCDGCDLAVHQECYGVPFIPEGQWLCRKCQLIGRGVPTCIFCPNTDGAFKQTNASKWAHLLCAMWIPEVSLGNHTFMEPVMEVEKVPKNRWKLKCYLCNQSMGACIQCGNKACYQAFHVTCARRARLFLKMKNSHGTLAVLDGTTVLKAFCDKHCPADYTKENNVPRATREARLFYKKTMRGRLWADSQASALMMADKHRHAVTEHEPDQSQLTGMRVALTIGEAKKKGNSPQRPVWKLPSGAPVIPKSVFDIVEKSLQRFTIHKRKEYTADACRYWTLKREARRGAALLKRLQLQMETFSSMEVTRRNFAGMGPAGRPRLERRIEFARTLIEDLERLKELSQDTENREFEKLRAAQLEEDLIDTVYFPVARLLPQILHKELGGERAEKFNVFTEGLRKLRSKVEARFYTSAIFFISDLSDVLRNGIMHEPALSAEQSTENLSPAKKASTDMRERRRVAKRIVKSMQPLIEAAARAEADICSKSVESQLQEVRKLLDDAVSVQPGETASIADADVEVEEASTLQLVNGDAPTPRTTRQQRAAAVAETLDVEMKDLDADDEESDTINVTPIEEATEPLIEVNGNVTSPSKRTRSNGIKNTITPPSTNGSNTAPEDILRSPPTPPVSTGDSSTNSNTASNSDSGGILNQGGAVWYLKDFQPEGTTILASGSKEETSAMSDVLSEMDDEELRGLGGDMEVDSKVAPFVLSPTKNKKGKAKKRSGRRR